MVCAPRQFENGAKIGDVCREMGVSDVTFHRWRKQYAMLGIPELRRLKPLEEESGRLNPSLPNGRSFQPSSQKVRLVPD